MFNAIPWIFVGCSAQSQLKCGRNGSVLIELDATEKKEMEVETSRDVLMDGRHLFAFQSF